MNKLLYLFLLTIDKLSDKFVYIVSDFTFFLLYRIFNYRVFIVRNNIQNSFPNLSENEVLNIEIKFYKNFCDILVESLLLNIISKEKIQKKMFFLNPEIFSNLDSKKKGIMLIGAHYNNWEWMALSLSSYFKNDMYSVYKPFNSKKIDRYMKKSRERFGANIIPMENYVKTVIQNKNTPKINLMLADQSPQKDKLDFFCDFLNQDTPIFLGPEKLAKSANLELYFIQVDRIKRGYYQMKAILLSNELPKKIGVYTKMHTKYLEKIIIKNPENWLWTHRRWKHSRKK